jgi:hypothetical protein
MPREPGGTGRASNATDTEPGGTMILKKAMLLGAAMALASTPAWALPGNEHAHKGTHHPTSTPNDKSNPGSSKRSESGDKHAGGAENKGKGKGNGSGKSHKCMPHGVAYVASGTLVSDTLTEGADHTVSGELTVEVLRTNHHARADKGTKKTYTVENAHVKLVVPDSDEDGTVGVDDLAAGDRVKVIGKVTTLAKKCKTGEFSPKLTIRRLVFHGPAQSSSTTTTTTTSTSTSSSLTTSTTTTSTSTTT